MSWFSENVFDPIANVGNALFHGDITGGQYQASGSDYLKTLGVAGAAALPFVAGPALGAAGAGLGFAGPGEAAGAIAPEVAATAGTYGGELTGASLPFAAGTIPPDVAATAGTYGGELMAGATPASIVGGDFSALGYPAAESAILSNPAAYGAMNLGATAAEGSVPGIAAATTAAETGAAAAPWYAGIPGASWLAAQNPAYLAAAGVGGASLLSGGLNRMFNPTLPNEQQQRNIALGLQQQAGQVGATGQQLTQPLLTGQLPPEAEASVQAAMKDADATIRSQYARLGLTGSTPEADQLANLSLRFEAMRFQIAQQMANSGQNLLQLASQDLGAEANIYQGLMQTQISEDNATRDSFAKLAGSLALAGAIGGRKA
jgi:hypothetical protein